MDISRSRCAFIARWPTIGVLPSRVIVGLLQEAGAHGHAPLNCEAEPIRWFDRLSAWQDGSRSGSPRSSTFDVTGLLVASITHDMAVRRAVGATLLAISADERGGPPPGRRACWYDSRCCSPSLRLPVRCHAGAPAVLVGHADP
jgi:hypothetical protein